MGPSDSRASTPPTLGEDILVPAGGEAHHAIDLLELAEVSVLLLDGSEAHLHRAEARQRHLVLVQPAGDSARRGGVLEVAGLVCVGEGERVGRTRRGRRGVIVRPVGCGGRAARAALGADVEVA
eukprot:scaffold28455_cov60-Phaeocystis_antarctica.AAC.2